MEGAPQRGKAMVAKYLRAADRARCVRSKLHKMMAVATLADHHVTENLGDGISASRREIRQWLSERDAKAASIERHRYQVIRLWTIFAAVTGSLAAIAAWLAAWPVIKEWMG
jgi:hypothetical protein